jgi:hypothetical protein
MLRTTVGSALVGTGQYNGLRETSFFCSPIRGDVGLTVVELAVSAFDCLDSARRMLVFFFNVA